VRAQLAGASAPLVDRLPPATGVFQPRASMFLIAVRGPIGSRPAPTDLHDGSALRSIPARARTTCFGNSKSEYVTEPSPRARRWFVRRGQDDAALSVAPAHARVVRTRIRTSRYRGVARISGRAP
jgi:hypothetical protein